MDYDSIQKMTDDLGTIAERIGKELRGWGILRQQYADCWATPGSVYYGHACQARLICIELLNLYSKRVLAAHNGNARRVRALSMAIAALEMQKKKLQQSCRETYLQYGESWLPGHGIFPPAPEEQEQHEQPEQEEQKSRPIAVLVAANIIVMVAAGDRKEQA